MFSLNEVDHIAWVIFLFMGGWIVVNALVDLSGDRNALSDSFAEGAAAEEQRIKRN